MSKIHNLNVREEKYQFLLESSSPRNLQKVTFHYKQQKKKFSPKFLMLLNQITFSFIFLLLPEKILLDEGHYIEITFVTEGENQAISDSYSGVFPYVNGSKQNQLSSSNKNVDAEEGLTDNKIILQWDEPLSDFSHMFENLENITSVNIFNMFTNDVILSYMFHNCINLIYVLLMFLT